ncbi:RNA methyltransferase [Nocardioides sp. TRM66260-LWL]|uniref:TrmH family RNA methyltransferase n=1 Tax=Nocardioides sp. TRM66260-LWL TaxID=2874478 RepID=UPI001CC425BD|nr:RNA methyltransferase [Nocardioides sp. TRM66260-LWL]MBZ5733939.1 RNA methyltransferase [Nocardioides sp. TRM66260-LWL]
MAELVEITDPADPRLADYRDLRDVSLRRHLEAEHGLFLAEGEKVVRRAVLAGHRPRSFLMAPRWLDGLADVLASSDAPCYVVGEDLAERVTGFHVHRGALASLHRLPLPSLDDVLSGDPARVAVLEGVVDHANVGALARNAAALGVGALLLDPTCADPLYRRAVKVSMGATLQLPWTRLDPLADGVAALRDRGYVVAGMTLSEASVSIDEVAADPPARLALVFGTEGHGLTERARRLLDLEIVIPMAAGIDSLNVAASSAVAFHALRPRDGRA